MPKRFCLKCKTLFTTNGGSGKSYCPPCQADITARMNARPKGNTTQRGLGWTHQKRARESITPADLCWRCGQPGTPADPITADHETPRAQGGSDSPLRPAHRSCNSRRGAQQRRTQQP